MIYATPFRESDKQILGPSTDSGMTSLDQVVDMMGGGYVRLTKRMVIYGPGDNSIVFSDFRFTS